MCIWSLFTTQLSLYAIVFKRIFWNNPTAETCVHMLTRERWVEKSVLRYVRTKWMAADECCGMFLCIGTAKYIKPSPSARKMSLFSSIIIAIFLSCAIIQIYIILIFYIIFKPTSYDFKFTSYQFKSTSSRIIKSMKIQVKSLKIFTRN